MHCLCCVHCVREAGDRSLLKWWRVLLSHDSARGLCARWPSHSAAICTPRRPEYVNSWIRRCCQHLPAQLKFIPYHWRVETQKPIPSSATADLSTYFENTWISEEFPPILCGHIMTIWDTQDTTMLKAFTFHSRLNCHSGMPRPSLRKFLQWKQKAQFQVQCRIMQLCSALAEHQRRHSAHTFRTTPSSVQPKSITVWR